MEKKNKLILFPVGLIQQVEEYQKKNQLISFTAAVLELVRKGLETSK